MTDDEKADRDPDKERLGAAAKVNMKFTGDPSSLDALREKLGGIAGHVQTANAVSKMVEETQIDTARAMRNMPEMRAARAAETTAEAMLRLLDEAARAEQREVTMLRWNRAGVVLAAIAAVASVAAIIVAVALR